LLYNDHIYILDKAVSKLPLSSLLPSLHIMQMYACGYMYVICVYSVFHYSMPENFLKFCNMLLNDQVFVCVCVCVCASVCLSVCLWLTRPLSLSLSVSLSLSLSLFLCRSLSHSLRSIFLTSRFRSSLKCTSWSKQLRERAEAKPRSRRSSAGH